MKKTSLIIKSFSVLIMIIVLLTFISCPKKNGYISKDRQQKSHLEQQDLKSISNSNTSLKKYSLNAETGNYNLLLDVIQK